MQLIIISKTATVYTATLTNNQPAKISKPLTNYLDKLVNKELRLAK